MKYAELKQRLEQEFGTMVDAAVAPINEQHTALAEQYAELEEKQTDFMARITASHERQPEREPGHRVANLIRALAAGRGDVDRAAKWALEKWGDEEVAKTLTTGDAAGAGFLVPEEMSSEIIELLRPRSVIRSANPVIMPMPTGVMSIPRLTGGASAEYIGEATAQNATGLATGQLRLVWKKLRATVPVSNELLAFSNPAANAVVRNDLVQSLATREDQGFIRDDGTQDKPKGLRYWALAANISASNAANDSSVPTLAEVEKDFKQLIQALEGADVRMIRPRFLMSPRSKNFLMMLRDTNGNLAFPEMRTASPTILTIPVSISTNIPSNLGSGTDPESEIYLVDFADVVIGESTQLIIEVSNEASYTDASGTLVSAFDRDETVIKAIERHDFVVRHQESIAVKTGVVYGAV